MLGFFNMDSLPMFMPQARLKKGTIKKVKAKRKLYYMFPEPKNSQRVNVNSN